MPQKDIFTTTQVEIIIKNGKRKRSARGACINYAPVNLYMSVLNWRARRCFVFPTGGYGLKKIGSFLGYPFRNPGLNGLIVAHEYMKHIVDGLPLHRRFLEYNEDDVLALPYIMDWAIEEQAASDSLQLLMTNAFG